MSANESLKGKKVAILAADGYEKSELDSPREALMAAGAEVTIVSPDKGSIKAWDSGEWNGQVAVDITLEEASPDNYDALVLPGGVLNPDNLRGVEEAVAFARAFFDQNKPVAAICHGPQTLVDAGVLKGRRMTSYASVKQDMKNAGAEWVDEEVVVDGNLITSRSPSDLEAFNREMIRAFSKAESERRRAA